LRDADHKTVRTIPRIGYRLEVPDAIVGKSILNPSIPIDKVHISGNSTEVNLLAEEIYEKLVLVLFSRTGVRIFTQEANLEEADYIVQCSASASESSAKLFISLSEAKQRGNFFPKVSKVIAVILKSFQQLLPRKFRVFFGCME
jgi:hypothetical protein